MSEGGDSTGAAAQPPQVKVVTRGQQKELLEIAIEGSLTAATLPEAWPQTLDPIDRVRPRQMILDAQRLEYCDGAGLGLLAEVRRQLAGWGGTLELRNLSPELQSLIDLAKLNDPSAPQLRPPPRAGFVAAVGHATATLGDEVYAIIAFFGEVCAAITWAIFHPRELRWRDLFATADKVGPNALPVICLLGFLIGLILAFQSATPLERYGVRDTIPTMVSISVVRELGPLIATLLLAGRTGSAFAAELGTMKVTEEISALRAMGLDPVRFLVVPRVLAAIAMAPILAIFSSLMGILGGYSVMANFGFTFSRYIHQVQRAVTYHDVIGGEVKTLAFGLIVGGIGCLRGLRTGKGPGAVGDSATAAVVTSIVLIIATDGVCGVLFYFLHL